MKMPDEDIEIDRLDNQALVTYYETSGGGLNEEVFYRDEGDEKDKNNLETTEIIFTGRKR
jgi:hypothetical protein